MKQAFSLRSEHHLNLITIRRKADEDGEPEVLSGAMRSETVFQQGDPLLLYGRDRDLRRFGERVGSESADEDF